MSDDIAVRQQVELQPNAVVGPIQIAVHDCIDLVGITLQALDQVDLDHPPQIPGTPMSVQINLLGDPLEARRLRYQNWIIAKAIHDLTRALRQTLELALVYAEVVHEAPNFETWEELQTFDDARSAAANALNNPQLIQQLNGRLSEPLELEPQLRSLISLRNCLEHRHGVVGTKDLDPTGNLVLSLPHLKVFYREGDEEVELLPGIQVLQAVEVHARRAIRERTFGLGDLIAINPAEFVEIAHGCQLLSNDVVSRLPGVVVV